MEVALGILGVLVGGAARISHASGTKITASSPALFLDSTTQKIHLFLFLVCEELLTFQPLPAKENMLLLAISSAPIFCNI